MKLLLFSDVHCDLQQCEKLLKLSQSVDAVVAAGDIGLVRKGLKKTIAVLQSITKPTILVPGNSESFEELQDACAGWKTAHVLHGTGVQVQGRHFFGVGGGIPVTPFGDWSYDFTEKEAEKMLDTCPPGCILVTHSPPKGAVDVSSTGQSFGSQAIRRAVVMKTPVLCVCGHIHESAGKEAWIENTPVVNAGPRGIVWELS